MQFFKNLSVRFKILIPVILLGILLWGTGVLGIIGTKKLIDASTDISSNYAKSIELVGDLNTNYQALQRVAYAHIVADTDEAQRALEAECDALNMTIQDLATEYAGYLMSDEETATFMQMKDNYLAYLELYGMVIQLSATGEDVAATILANGDLKEAGNNMTAEINHLEEINREAMQRAVGEEEETYKSVSTAIGTCITIGLLMLAFVIWIAWKWVCKRLININRQLRGIIAKIEDGHGDLTMRVQKLCVDEIGTLADGINVFIETLQKIMGQINLSSGQLGNIVATVSDKVATANSSSVDISSVMEELSASMEEIASTVTDIKQNVVTADDNLGTLADASQGLYGYANEMHKRAEELERNAVENKNHTSDVVNEIIESLKKAIEDSKSVEQVNSLTNEILSISSQTNLLALNASIEAARAGEAGRGFAVVADEISQLADSSRVAASNIQEINNMVVRAVHELIDSSDSMVKYISESILPDYDGFVHAGQQYNEDAIHVNETVDEFNRMSADLKNLMENITTAIEDINSAVNESAEGVTNAAINTSDLVKDINEIEHAMEDNRTVAGELSDEADRFVNL